MEQPEGRHLVSERTEGHISSQVTESMSMQKKTVPEQELSGERRCFACNETSHDLDECRIKYNLVTVPHQFGYGTNFPFITIQPSEEMVEKEKFYHHYVLITSNISNLDLGIVKGELQKVWNLSGSWVLRRECGNNFLASFSSEGHVVSCLKHPTVEILLDDKELKFTVKRWKEGDEESSYLIKQWFSVCGVPKIYRNWKELYQVASPFGVLIEVDQKSLEVGDKEPIRLKIALRSLDGAPFSYHFVVGWSSRMVKLTVEVKIDSDKSSHNTRIVTTTGNHVLDFGEFSTRLIGEDYFKGKPKPPIKHVFKRRGKKQQVTKAISTSKTERAQLVTAHTKGVSMDHMGPGGVQFHVKQYASKMVNEALETSRKFMDKPVTVNVPRHEELKDITQFYLRVEKEGQKVGKLYTLLKTLEVSKMIIFVNTKDKVMSLTEDVGKHYTVSASHDDMHQHARDTAIQKFQYGSSSILITTDLQGTNVVVQVPAVINYDLPTQLMQYIHRVQPQQSGQSGRKRVVIDMVTPADEHILLDIRRFCYRKMRELPSNV